MGASRPAGRLFDRYVMVDWSSSSRPTSSTPRKDAIWVGDLPADGPSTEHYCRTRDGAMDAVEAIIRDGRSRGERILIGFDFAFGYPRGFARAAGLEGAEESPWQATWQFLGASIEDGPDNANNRFAVASRINAMVGPTPGPFWGCPVSAATDFLGSRHRGIFEYPYSTPIGELARLRVTERHMPGVQPTWKLFTTGSVGGQVLVGIPRVQALATDPEWSDVTTIWPFETGLVDDPLASDDDTILIAEIWPGIVDAHALDALVATGYIRDQGQVRLMCEWARDHDAASTLGAFFAPRVEDPGDRAAIVTEEGWILGCTIPAGVS